MVRLARRPSLWFSFVLRVAFVIVAAIAVIAALYFVWKRRTFFMLALVVLIAIAAVWELLRFTVHMRHRPPRVEIDRYPLAYGESAELRVIETQALREIGVKLIGECRTTAATDISEYRETKVARTRCYEQELFRAKPGEPIVVRVQLPKSPPADGMAWAIVIESTLEHGAVVEHPYPIHVRENS